MQNSANDNAVIVSLNTVCEMTSLSRTCVNKFRLAGQFPQPVVLGERRIGFVKSEVLTWIAARIASRPASDNASTRQAA
jgi:prophage regulatory protein